MYLTKKLNFQCETLIQLPTHHFISLKSCLFYFIFFFIFFNQSNKHLVGTLFVVLLLS